MWCFKHIYLILTILFLGFLSVCGQKDVIELNEDNWEDMLENEWMIEFFAPWCPACKALERTWNQYAEQSPGLGIKVGKVDVTTAPGLSGRFMVTALPTIFHVLNGEFRQYKGTRDKESLITFIEKAKWKEITPIPGWKAPNSFQMSIVSSFFKLSQSLRQLHQKLMDDFGLPTWGSYLIFALVTILMGGLLGLALVFILDIVYPSKQSLGVKVDKLKTKKKEDNSDGDEELADEDIRDDLIDDASHSDLENSQDSASDKEKSTNKVKKRVARRAN